jgi:DNA repair exonuclease SbcCD nuclease subunit
MTRLVAVGDAHLGRSHLAHLRDSEGRNLREEDFLRSFAWAIDKTIELEPDGFVWLGDIFDHARPTYRTFAHVLAGLQRLADASLHGVAISGNHDTPRVRGTGSPYDALERVFPNTVFAWRMEAITTRIGDVCVHAVPQTTSVEEWRAQLDVAASRVDSGRTNLLLAHVALSSLPTRTWRDINELEVEESAFAAAFDMVMLGHYHAFQKVSKKTWYAGSTDTFSFADSPESPKGLALIDTEARRIEHIENPHARPLATVSVQTAGLSAGELVDAVERSAGGTREGAIVRVYLNEVDPATFRQVSAEQFQETVPSALYVQVEPDFGAGAIPVQGGPQIRSIEREWEAYVALQDLAGLERERVSALGLRFLEEARGETV